MWAFDVGRNSKYDESKKDYLKEVFDDFFLFYANTAEPTELQHLKLDLYFKNKFIKKIEFHQPSINRGATNIVFRLCDNFIYPLNQENRHKGSKNTGINNNDKIKDNFYFFPDKIQEENETNKEEIKNISVYDNYWNEIDKIEWDYRFCYSVDDYIYLVFQERKTKKIKFFDRNMKKFVEPTIFEEETKFLLSINNHYHDYDLLFLKNVRHPIDTTNYYSNDHFLSYLKPFKFVLSKFEKVLKDDLNIQYQDIIIKNLKSNKNTIIQHNKSQCYFRVNFSIDISFNESDNELGKNEIINSLVNKLNLDKKKFKFSEETNWIVLLSYNEFEMFIYENWESFITEFNTNLFKKINEFSWKEPYNYAREFFVFEDRYWKIHLYKRDRDTNDMYFVWELDNIANLDSPREVFAYYHDKHFFIYKDWEEIFKQQIQFDDPSIFNLVESFCVKILWNQVYFFERNYFLKIYEIKKGKVNMYSDIDLNKLTWINTIFKLKKYDNYWFFSKKKTWEIRKDNYFPYENKLYYYNLWKNFSNWLFFEEKKFFMHSCYFLKRESKDVKDLNYSRYWLKWLFHSFFSEVKHLVWFGVNKNSKYSFVWNLYAKNINKILEIDNFTNENNPTKILPNLDTTLIKFKKKETIFLDNWKIYCYLKDISVFELNISYLF